MSSFKAYPSYKDSDSPWFPSIPEHWTIIANRYIFDMKKSQVGKKSNQYTLLSLTLNGIIKRDMENPSGKFPAEFDTYQEVKKGDFIFCLFDVEETPRAVGLSKFDGMITGAYTVFKNRLAQDANYLYYFFLSLDENKQWKPLYKGLRNTITKENFYSFKTPIPPIEEQTAIANFLDEKTAEIKEFIRLKEKTIELLKERKTAIINQAVTKGLDPNVEMQASGIEWLGEIPKHWQVKKLKYMFRITKRIVGELGYDVLSITQRGIVVKDITSGEGQLSMDYSKYQLIEQGDYGMNHMDLLTGFVDISKFRGVVSPDYRVFQVCSKVADPSYYLNLFQMGYKNKIFFAFGRGSSQLGRWRLPAEEFNNFQCPVPPIEEQKAIMNFLEEGVGEYDEEIKKIKKEIALIKEYQQSLISEAVTGKIDVRDYRLN